MPRLTDPDAIRALLATDRIWAAYALADLAPGFFEACDWFAAPAPAAALLLRYRAFATPVLITLGASQAVAQLLEEVADDGEVYLSIRPEIMPVIRARYTVLAEAPMWRMALNPARFEVPAGHGAAVRLGPADREALLALYADGAETGEAPDFFSPEMIEAGVFYGIREGQALVAAAGTHLYAPRESVGTVGNVYTRRDRRGRHLARQVTGAVTAELLRLGLQTIVLNVSQINPAAIQVYERLGYERYCGFYEGRAVSRANPGEAPAK